MFFEMFFGFLIACLVSSLYAKSVVMGHQKAWELPFLRSHSLAGDRGVSFREGGYSLMGDNQDFDPSRNMSSL
jgi:hypothetical protein